MATNESLVQGKQVSLFRNKGDEMKCFYVVSALLHDSSPLGKLKRFDTEEEARDHAKNIIKLREEEGSYPIKFFVLRMCGQVNTDVYSRAEEEGSLVRRHLEAILNIQEKHQCQEMIEARPLPTYEQSRKLS